MRNLLILLLLALVTGCEQNQKSNQQVEIPVTDTVVPTDTTLKANINIPEPWTQKAAAGIDFIATGNEPFWSIEIDEEKFIRYSTPDCVELTTPPVKATNINATTKLYEAETDMGKLELQIMNKTCINDMSGDSSAYTVHLTIKLKKD